MPATRTTASVLPLALASLATLAACGNSTGPKSGPSSPAHPRGVLAAPIATPAGRPFGIAVSPTGQVYVTLQDLNSVLPVELVSKTVGTQIPVGADPGDVLFDPTGKTAYVSGYNDGTVRVINVSLGTSQPLAQVGANAYRLALSATAQRLYVSSVDGHVYVVSTATMAVVDTIPLGGALQGMALNSTGSELYVSSTDGTVFRVNAATGAVQDSMVVGGSPQDVALSRDGTRLYVAEPDRLGGRARRRHPGHDGPVLRARRVRHAPHGGRDAALRDVADVGHRDRPRRGHGRCAEHAGHGRFTAPRGVRCRGDDGGDCE